MIPARTIYGLCGVCACHAQGFGWAPNERSRPIWVCGDDTCMGEAKRTYAMRQVEWDGIEREATIRAGERAGEFLDTIDKSDLAKLTPDEWRDFCTRMIGTYRSELAALVAGHGRDTKSNAPF